MKEKGGQAGKPVKRESQKEESKVVSECPHNPLESVTLLAKQSREFIINKNKEEILKFKYPTCFEKNTPVP